jgi:hypothetical protein
VFFFPATGYCIDQAETCSEVGSYGLDHLRVSMSRFLMRATRRAQGLRDPRSSVFFDMVNLIHEITYTHGNYGWLIENVDATDHRNALVRDEYNQVVKAILGPGYAFDAVAVGFHAHRFRRFWTNLISTILLHSMVEKQFSSRSQDQSVQNILEPGREAQLASHDHAPGPHSVNIVGEPLKAF